jgi:hypothetical protein
MKKIIIIISTLILFLYFDISVKAQERQKIEISQRTYKFLRSSQIRMDSIQSLFFEYQIKDSLFRSNNDSLHKAKDLLIKQKQKIINDYKNFCDTLSMNNKSLNGKNKDLSEKIKKSEIKTKRMKKVIIAESALLVIILILIL